MMKLIVILLLIANAVLIGWQYNRHIERATREVVERKRAELPPDVPRLTLLAELPELPPLREPAPAAPERTVESDVKTDVAAADLCLDIGPFEQAEARDALGEWLHDLVASTHTRTETERTRQFFWVYLEPTDTPETAQRNLSELANKGVSDYMLISRGDLKNAISLGLFRSQDSVNRRLAELSEKGYKPVVVPRFEVADRYYISVQLAATQTTPPEFPPDLLGQAQATTIPCTTMQTSGEPPPTPTPPPAPDEPLVEGLTD
jgi:hypothetical protein